MSVADSTSMPQPGSAAPSTPFGEVYDRGYQRYDGPRLGRKHAFQALIFYSMKRALGAKKSWTAKVIPAMLYIGVTITVVIPIGIRAFLPDAAVVEYWEFFNIIFLLLGVYVATIAPEMLCPDRRENVLMLYFSRAITRLDYLLAKLVATALLTLTISLLPVVVYWLGRQLLADSPLSAMRDNLGDLGRVAIASIVIAFYLGAIGLAISSFTGRKSIAVAIIIIGFLVSTALAGILPEVTDDPDIDRFFAFLSPAFTVDYFVYGLFGQELIDPTFGQSFDTWVYGAVMLAIIAICCGIMYWRYVPSD
jgi:ABC-2 type transport system permease protein